GPLFFPKKVFPLRGPHPPTACMGQLLCFRQITLTPPEFAFCFLALGDIHNGPDKLYELARLVQDGMAYSMEMLDRPIGNNNAVVRLIICFLDFGCFKEFPDALLVVGMISAKP